MQLLPNTHYLELALAAQVLNGLSFIHSAGAKSVFSAIAEEGLEPDWYNCDTETATLLLSLLQSAKVFQGLKQQVANITFVFPQELNATFEKLYLSLCDYEPLMQKLSAGKLTEAQIENEILKAAMFYNRERMSEKMFFMQL